MNDFLIDDTRDHRDAAYEMEISVEAAGQQIICFD